jgi:hypothetical protein
MGDVTLDALASIASIGFIKGSELMAINPDGWEINEAGNLTAYPYVSSQTAVLAEEAIALQIAVATDAQAPQTIGARYQVILSPDEARRVAQVLLRAADKLDASPRPRPN